MNKWKNKNAIVTGGGSGIGRCLAIELAKEKVNVIITDINSARLKEVVKELKEFGIEAKGYRVDHSKLVDVKKFKKDFKRDFGSVEILCLNAGIALSKGISEMQIKDWEKIMAVNFYGTVYMLDQFVNDLVEQKSGNILITASGAGLSAVPGLSAYSASKYAMVGIAESIRTELKQHNISVSALCPGVISTNIIKDSKIEIGSKDSQSAMKQKIDNFYQKFGTSPVVVARHGVKAMKKNKSIQPTPFHMKSLYSLKRFSHSLSNLLSYISWKFIIKNK